jgi:hypothetical protein
LHGARQDQPFGHFLQSLKTSGSSRSCSQMSCPILRRAAPLHDHELIGLRRSGLPH